MPNDYPTFPGRALGKLREGIPKRKTTSESQGQDKRVPRKSSIRDLFSRSKTGQPCSQHSSSDNGYTSKSGSNGFSSSSASTSTKPTLADSSANGRSDSDISVPPGQFPIGTCMGEPPDWFNQSIGGNYRRSRFLECLRDDAEEKDERREEEGGVAGGGG